MEKKTILVIAAHPDDEVLGCGGTIARMAQEGNTVFVAILGEGITSRFNQRKEADCRLVSDLKQNCRQAAETLGVREVVMFDFPDNRFDEVPLLDIVKTVEKTLTKIRPHVVYTNHGGDLNIDHAITFRATLTACRPVNNWSIRQIFTYEVPSSTEWSFGQLAPVFRPNTFVDITSFLETKLKAMHTYESEMRRFPHPRSAEALKVIAQRWGSVAGLQSAEAFELIWMTL